MEMKIPSGAGTTHIQSDYKCSSESDSCRTCQVFLPFKYALKSVAHDAVNDAQYPGHEYLPLHCATPRYQQLSPYVPRPNDTKILSRDELNKILLNTVTHSWAKQFMMIGFELKSKMFRSAR